MKIKKFFRRLLRVILLIVVFIIATTYMIKYLNPAIGRAPIANEINSPNFDGKAFINPIPTTAGGLGDMPGIMMDYMTR